MSFFKSYIIEEIKHLDELYNTIDNSNNENKQKVMKKINKKIEYLYVQYSRNSEYCLLEYFDILRLILLRFKLIVFYVYVFIIL